MEFIKGKIIIENGIIKNIIPDKSSTKELIIIDKDKQFVYNNATAISGVIDSHLHLWGIGMLMNDANLTGVNSLEECLEIVSKHKPNRGEWLFGRGWNEQLWQDKQFPNAKQLDALFPDTPVFLFRVDGHAAWVNTKAMQIAKIVQFTPNPSGGEIIKTQSGEPTGIFVDNAFNLISDLIPYYNEQYLEKMILDAQKDCLSKGIIGVDDMDVPPQQIPIFKKLAQTGKLVLDVRSYVSAQNDEYLKNGILPAQYDNFKIVGVKFFMDGALGSRGAALIEPYNDSSDSNGLILMDENELYTKATRAIELGFEIAVHCIGDAANKMALNVFKKIREKNKNAVLRIEHCQILQTEDIEKFAELNVIASIQPIHFKSDYDMAIQRLGIKRFEKNGYRWNSLFKTGAKVISGSDAPIESNDPFIGIHSFLNRSDNETISPELAFSSYTTIPSQIRNSNSKQFLKENHPADFIVIENYKPENIKDFSNVKVLAVYKNGDLVYTLI